MKHILMIGNGFDLAHGLNTSYEDFITFCAFIKTLMPMLKEEPFTAWKPQMDQQFALSVSRKLLNYIKQDDSREERTLFFTACEQNIWLDYVIQHKNTIGKRWSDLEYTIGNMIEALAYVHHHPNIHKDSDALLHLRSYQEVHMILTMMDKQKGEFYIQREAIKQLFLSHLRQLTWMLEIYIKRFLNDKRKKMELFACLPVTYLLNFNYTDTYQKLYNQDIVVHNIHGVAKLHNHINENTMVFGIGQDIRYVEHDDCYDYVEFQKYYQRITKKTGVKYKQWLKDASDTYVYIFGHSLDSVDGDVIKDILHSDVKNVLVFYHNQEALHTYVMNLIKILGKDEVIDQTSKERLLFLASDDIASVKQFLRKHEMMQIVLDKRHG